MNFKAITKDSQTLNLAARDTGFIDAVKKLSGQTPARCLQCGKCTAGCPASFAYDYSVSQVMRLVQEGQKDTVLSCKAIWLCLSCQTCGVRCPAGIDVPAVMDALRQLSFKEGKVGVKAVNSFQQSFLDSAKKHGRIHELGLMVDFVRRTGRIFQDVALGPKVLAKRKLSIKPHDIKGREQVLEIMERFEAESRNAKS